MKLLNYWTHYAILFLAFNLHLQIYGWCTQQVSQPHFVIIIPSYNNISWHVQNLDSIFSQDYNDFHVIYIDDCSTDGTGDAVAQYIHTNDVWNNVTFIKSDKRRGALANLYHAIHTCNDTDIIITVDGDDWLAHDHVLSHLANVYSDANIWMTFGQFAEFPSGKIGHCRPLAKQAIAHNSFRDEPS